MRTPSISLLAATLLGLASAAHAEEATVQGYVVDERGERVTEYEAAMSWMWTDGHAKPSRSFEVGANGTFSGDFNVRGNQAVVVYADGGRMAGVAPITSDEEIVVTLRPAVHVTGRFGCSELGELGSFSVHWSIDRTRPVMARPKDGVLDMWLPEGDWRIMGYGSDVKTYRNKLTLERGAHDLGEVDLPGTFIAMNVGRPVEEWNVTEARGVGLDAAQIQSFRGQWLLVEFWGFW